MINCKPQNWILFFLKRKRKNPDQDMHLGLIFRKQTNKQKAKLGYSLELVFDILFIQKPSMCIMFWK
jgi:hypothetical protein